MLPTQIIIQHTQDQIHEQLPENYYIKTIEFTNTNQAFCIMNKKQAKNRLLYVYTSTSIMSTPPIHHKSIKPTTFHYADPEYPDNFIKHILDQIQ